MAEQTRWLTEQEDQIWRSFLEASARISAQLNQSLKQHAALSMDDYEVLVHLSEAAERRLRMSDLSRRLLHSQSRLTQRVDRLVKRGLVEREKCENDGRGTFAVLTEAGMQAIVAAAPQHVADVRELVIDQITADERAVIANVFERLAASSRTTDST